MMWLIPCIAFLAFLQAAEMKGIRCPDGKECPLGKTCREVSSGFFECSDLPDENQLNKKLVPGAVSSTMLNVSQGSDSNLQHSDYDCDGTWCGYLQCCPSFKNAECCNDFLCCASIATCCGTGDSRWCCLKTQLCHSDYGYCKKTGECCGNDVCCESNEKCCGTSSPQWCCLKSQRCGNNYGSCNANGDCCNDKLCCESNEKCCGSGDSKWCCLKSQQCGSNYGSCNANGDCCNDKLCCESNEKCCGSGDLKWCCLKSLKCGSDYGNCKAGASALLPAIASLVLMFLLVLSKNFF